jgi:hypothetical protein
LFCNQHHSAINIILSCEIHLTIHQQQMDADAIRQTSHKGNTFYYAINIILQSTSFYHVRFILLIHTKATSIDMLFKAYTAHKCCAKKHAPKDNNGSTTAVRCMAALYDAEHNMPAASAACLDAERNILESRSLMQMAGRGSSWRPMH